MERHFSEQQVSEIIRKAAEVQSRHKTAGSQPSHGISESELKRVASELGIDRDALISAIAEVASTTLEDTGSLSTVDRILERSVVGELTQDQIGVVLEEFTPTAGIGQQTIAVGNNLSYQSLVGMAQCNINVSNRSGKTTLRVKSSAFLSFLPTFLPAGFISLITNIVIWEEMRLSTSEGLPPAVLIPVGLLIAAFYCFKKLVRYSNQKILDLTNRAAAKLSESADHLRINLHGAGIPAPEVIQDEFSTREQNEERQTT